MSFIGIISLEAGLNMKPEDVLRAHTRGAIVDNAARLVKRSDADQHRLMIWSDCAQRSA